MERTGARRASELVCVKKVIDNTNLISTAVEKVTDVANAILIPHGRGITLQSDMNSGLVVPRGTVRDHALFLREHIDKALQVSEASRLMAGAKTPERRSEIRRLFIDVLNGQNKDGFVQKLPGSDSRRLSGLSVLNEDPLFSNHFKPVLEELNILGDEIGVQISQAEADRKKVLKNQKGIKGSVTKASRAAQKAGADADNGRRVLDNVTQDYLSGLGGFRDMSNQDIDKLIKTADSASRIESNGRVKEGWAIGRMRNAVAAFFPATETTRTVTGAVRAMIDIDTAINQAFLQVVACYQATVSLSIEMKSLEWRGVFDDFLGRLADRRKQISEQVRSIRETDVPSNIEKNGKLKNE